MSEPECPFCIVEVEVHDGMGRFKIIVIDPSCTTHQKTREETT